jgi:hypothetical protein
MYYMLKLLVTWSMGCLVREEKLQPSVILSPQMENHHQPTRVHLLLK